MKTLLRLWSLVLDFVMLVLLLAAPVPAQNTGARVELITTRPELARVSTSRFAFRRSKP